MEIEVESTEPVAPRNALPRVVERSTNAVVDVGSEALGVAFERFLTEVGEMLDRAPDSIGGYVMDELELSISIAATGDFRIASSTATGALKVTLRRPASASTQD
jgi:hypothetical protein